MARPLHRLLAVAGFAVGVVLGCSTQSALERYCTRTGSCACAEGRCCIREGFACEAGQPCCVGTCTGGVCPGGGDGGSDGGTDGGGRAACGTAGCFADGGCALASCLRDGGCPNGICCQGDPQCASGRCLVDECASLTDFRSEGEVCDDLTDCRTGTRCDRSTWPPRCQAYVDAGPPACWANEVLCTDAVQCCGGTCEWGACQTSCAGEDAGCARAADCCATDELACDDTARCGFAPRGEWPAGYRCALSDQCASKRCVAGTCLVLDGLHPGAQAACLGVPCEGEAVCDAGVCCLPAGVGCVDDHSCCGQQCLAGRCVPPGTCAGPLERCGDDSDCCAPFGCNSQEHRCVLTVDNTLWTVACVPENNETCRRPFSGDACRLPGGQTFDLPCCIERGADGGRVSCEDAGTCTCSGGNCTPVDGGYVCPVF